MRDLGYNTYMFTATIYTPDGNMMISTELKILVEEEYGYRYWSWIPDDVSIEVVESKFNEAISDPIAWSRLYFHDLTQMGGEWTELVMPEDLTEDEEDEWVVHNMDDGDYHGMATVRYDGNDSRILWNTEKV
tara:strand:+ start:416 stop:811 length:396 start_codon:yes stop_codon:yes gene_type:complete